LFGQGFADTSVAVVVATATVIVDAMKMAKATQRTKSVNVRITSLRQWWVAMN